MHRYQCHTYTITTWTKRNKIIVYQTLMAYHNLVDVSLFIDSIELLMDAWGLKARCNSPLCWWLVKIIYVNELVQHWLRLWPVACSVPTHYETNFCLMSIKHSAALESGLNLKNTLSRSNTPENAFDSQDKIIWAHLRLGQDDTMFANDTLQVSMLRNIFILTNYSGVLL